MNNTKLSILITLFACTSQEKNHYSLVSVNKIRKLLAQFHGIHVERWWIFKCNRYLIDNGFISRRARYKHHSNGTINQLSSITALTLKGAKFLMTKRIKGAKKLMKRILAWIKNRDKRFPAEKDLLAAIAEKISPEELRRLEDLANMVGKPIPP